ncbi:MAG: hypothetical protein ABFD94_10025 [Armatimonadia bacterium]
MDMTPEDVREAKARAKADKAYDASLRNTEPGWGARTGIEAAAAERAYKRARDLPDSAMLRDVEDAKNAARSEIRRETRGKAPKAYAKGGSVSSASKRADGIAQRGKTRGKTY